MNNGIFEKTDFGIYHFADIIDGVLENTFPYIVNISAIFGEGEIQYYLKPFKKHSCFHSFIGFIVDSVFQEDPGFIDTNSKDRMLYLDHWFVKYGFVDGRFDEWAKSKGFEIDQASVDDIDEYLEAVILSEEYENLIFQISNEVFYLMFSNRKIMLRFNHLISNYLRTLNKTEIIPDNLCYLKKDGKLKRRALPKWVKDAVFFRDRGRCVLCNKDLSNLVSRQNLNNYDHIVPLNFYGFNDVTNIQLLCEKCNKKKGGNYISTSQVYEKWYR
ncbi:HNH endonuclease [Enterococcus sp. 669A]|uniref:HNH endonuclease n=1 Tax=Candidatus Enterococcus moelleringii TaxID=2815325 RepID=A0ABS3LDW2_9ENTE|nr:HNH endonuclease signature motif containing protein [Enterococcus sp. 669A]MBO1307814.1 HNH endonuclease [Enterococcus sp. 669A]